MPIPTEPLFLALFSLRSILDAFVVGALGLQIMGQLPGLRALLKFSLPAGILLFLLRIAPLDPPGQLAATFILLVFILLRTRQAGLFVTTAAVVLGHYVLLQARWFLAQLRLFPDILPADLSRGHLSLLLQDASAALLLAVLVCLIAYLQGRARSALPSTRNYGALMRMIDKNWRKRLIPVSMLFTVLFTSYIVNAFFYSDPYSPAATLLPLVISSLIVCCAYIRELRITAPGGGTRFPLFEYLDLAALAPFIHFAVQVSGGKESVFKLLFIPFVLANALKSLPGIGFLAFLLASGSLLAQAALSNLQETAWNLETDLLYMGTFFLTFVLAQQFSREESRWQQVLNAKIYTDHVTGLHNYHYVKDFLQNRSDDEQGVLYMLLIDLDGFKIVNDRFGHPLGDQFLARMGQAVRQALGPDDIAARYGSDEFLVLVNNEEEEKVLNLAARIQENIRQEAAYFLSEHDADALTPRFTASIGISRSYNVPDARTWLLNQADQNLQEAKRAGKNQLVFREIDDIPL